MDKNKIGQFTYMRSTAKNKKLMVVSPKGKLIHFGDLRYQHFFDKTGLLDKKLNHKDKVRRISYLQRYYRLNKCINIIVNFLKKIKN